MLRSYKMCSIGTFLIHMMVAMTMMRMADAMAIQCPTLVCRTQSLDDDKKHLADNICFQHDGGNPTLKLIGDSCLHHQYKTEETTGPVYCDFDLISNEFAWIDEMTQHLDSVNDFEVEKAADCPRIKPTPGNEGKEWSAKIPCDKIRANSQVYGKRTQAECKEQPSMFQMLLGGRNCTESTQCLSLVCEERGGDGSNSQQKICKGRTEAESCYNHSDCDAGYFCEVGIEFPHKTTCKSLRTSYERCTETQQCQHNLYCWYANKESSPILKSTENSRQCLPMYSQRDGYKYGWFSKSPEDETTLTLHDFWINGKYCKSGLAFFNSKIGASECVSTIKITQKDENDIDKKIVAPYQCDPTDNERPCKIFYGDKQSFDVPCRCSLGDPKVGYCGSIIGTKDYEAALVDLKGMHEKAFKCHTLDRENMVAQIDCNEEESTVSPAADKKFKIEHWPYMHQDVADKSTATFCITSISGKTYLPNILSSALPKVTLSVAAAALPFFAIQLL